MLLSKDDIETPRTPAQLQEFVRTIEGRVRADPGELEAGNQRQGYYKEFLDEVIPLARFAAQAVDPSHTIQPVLGSQGYDAIIRDADGSVVDKVEIANPIDGAAIADDAQKVVRDGIGTFRMGNPGDEVEDLIPIIARIAKKKGMKDYSDATVVFNVSALPPFPGFEARHEEQVNRIKAILAEAGFRAKRIFVLHPPARVDRIDA